MPSRCRRVLRWVESERAPRGCRSSWQTQAASRSGSRSSSTVARPLPREQLPNDRGGGVDEAALDPRRRRDELALPLKRRRGRSRGIGRTGRTGRAALDDVQADGLHSLPREAAAEMLAPAALDVEAAVGGLQRRDLDAALGRSGATQRPSDAELRPARAAERQAPRPRARPRPRRRGSRTPASVRPRPIPTTGSACGRGRRPRGGDAARRAARARPSCRPGTRARCCRRRSRRRALQPSAAAPQDRSPRASARPRRGPAHSARRRPRAARCA